MPYELLAQYLKLPVFALVASRLGGLLMFQPVLGALAIPVRLRALLVLGLAALLTPLVSLPATPPDTPTPAPRLKRPSAAQPAGVTERPPASVKRELPEHLYPY